MSAEQTIQPTHQQPLDFIVIINGFGTKVNKASASTYCSTIKEFVESNAKADRIQIQIDFKNIKPFQSTIRKLLANEEIEIKTENLSFLNQLFQKLKFPEVENKKNEFIQTFSSPIEKSSELREVVNFERLVFTLSKDNRESILNETINAVNKNNIENYTIIFFTRFLVTPRDCEFLINFMISLNEKLIERKCRHIIPILKQICLRNLRLKIDKNFFYDNSVLQELSYLTIWLIEKQIISPSDDLLPMHSKLPPFFAHLMNKNSMHFDLPFHLMNIDWNLHKEKILLGDNNIDPIFKILREDDFKSLTNIIQVQMNFFNYNMIVPIQYYEKHSILVNYNIISSNSNNIVSMKKSLNILEYCAFFGSFECFKILFNGNSKLTKELTTFSCCGGNLDIIKMIDMKKNCNCSFEDNHIACLKAAIFYHRQNVVEWLIEYLNVEFCKSDTIQKIALTFFMNGNISCFLYFLKRGIAAYPFFEPNSFCGIASVERFLLYILSKNASFDFGSSYALNYACLSGNEETVKILLLKGSFDINKKTVLNLKSLLIL